MQSIGERPERRQFAVTDGGGKSGSANHELPILGAALQPPAVIDVDVAIALARQAAVDQCLRGSYDLLLIDIGRESVPAVPAHRRRQGATRGVSAPATGRSERIAAAFGRENAQRYQHRKYRAKPFHHCAFPSTTNDVFRSITARSR